MVGLSGGLDSSIITAICANQLARQGIQLPTFSVDYVDNDKYFVPYDGKAVCVTGNLYDDELIVEAVQIAEEPTAQKCQDSAPKKVKVCSAKKCRKQQLTLYALMKNRRT